MMRGVRPIGHGAELRHGLAVVLTSIPLLAVGACSLPFPVISFKAAEAELPVPPEPDTTGTLPSPRKTPVLAPELGEEDLRRANAALATALDPQGNGRPVKWDNPDSGMKGTINPVKPPYVEADEICRQFLAGITGPDFSRFVRGTACRPSGGAWTVRSARPAKSAG